MTRLRTELNTYPSSPIDYPIGYATGLESASEPLECSEDGPDAHDGCND